MKAVLLTLATIMASAGSMFAQNLPPDYYWEAGINGGLCGITRPLGPANAYEGTKTKPVADFSARLNYFLNPNWMLSLDIGDRKWQSEGSWTLNDKYGQTLRTRPITFLIADHALTETVGLNYVIPFYTRYNTYNRSNLYFGVQFGLVTTINDGSLSYSKYKASPDSGYTYTSKYDYAAGTGYTFGVQVGYTYYIVPRLGVNVEIGTRYAHVKTEDEHYASENSKFYLLYFPETIGLRWRF